MSGNKNQIIPKIKAITNKDKIIFFIVATVAVGFLGATFASNFMSSHTQDDGNQKQKDLVSQANIPSSSNTNYNNIPDYIEQNNSKKSDSSNSNT